VVKTTIEAAQGRMPVVAGAASTAPAFSEIVVLAPVAGVKFAEAKSTEPGLMRL
jgi:hypothetical protein